MASRSTMFHWDPGGMQGLTAVSAWVAFRSLLRLRDVPLFSQQAFAEYLLSATHKQWQQGLSAKNSWVGGDKIICKYRKK